MSLMIALHTRTTSTSLCSRRYRDRDRRTSELMTTQSISGIFAFTLALVGASTAAAQEHQFAPCSRDRTVSVQTVRVERLNPKSKTFVSVDTLVYPSDESVYVSAVVTGSLPKAGDSVYA